MTPQQRFEQWLATRGIVPQKTVDGEYSDHDTRVMWEAVRACLQLDRQDKPSRLVVDYDAGGDCLYITCDSNEPAKATEDKAGVILRHALSDGRAVGVTITDLRERQQHGEAVAWREILPDLIRHLDGVDTNQPGYHHASGWNDAIRRVMDVLRANTTPQPTEPVVNQSLVGDERDAFEAHCLVRGYERRDLTRLPDGYYVSSITYMWKGWQARAALVQPVKGEPSDERAAVDFYRRNPSAAVVDLQNRIHGQPAAGTVPVGEVDKFGNFVPLPGLAPNMKLFSGAQTAASAPQTETRIAPAIPGVRGPRPYIVPSAGAEPVAQEPVAVVAWRTVNSDGRPMTDWIDGAPAQDERPAWRGSRFELAYAAPVAAQPHVTDEMVTRFLGWRLPQDFAPDAGISFNPSPNPLCWPVGTNLLTAPQARAMLEYVLTGAQK